MTGSRLSREEVLAALAEGPLDLIVIGAGIVGTRIALDAARAGLRVGLVERGDIGGATSGASSKLIHGGFRYLASGQPRLVRTARREQAWLMSHAPVLARPLQLVTLVRDGIPPGRGTLAPALAAYRALSTRGRGAGRFRPPGDVCAMLPGLSPVGLRASLVLNEAITDDARLTLATAKAAANAGVLIAPQTEVIAFDHHRTIVAGVVVRDRLSGAESACRAAMVVNATGPWIDVLRRLDRARAPSCARFSKGVHCTMPLRTGWRAGLVIPTGRTAAVHAVPWKGLLLVGTTDEPYDDPCHPVVATCEDVDRITGVLASALDPGTIDPRGILASYAGLRVLPRGNGDVRSARRDHLLDVSPSGLVSVAGGKLTTHRPISRTALALLPIPIAATRTLTDPPLPGGTYPPHDRRLHRRLGEDIYAHLVTTYGAEIDQVLTDPAPDALERIHPDGPDIWAQVDHAIRCEWALHVDDIVHRRTTLALRGLATPRITEAVAARLTPTTKCP